MISNQSFAGLPPQLIDIKIDVTLESSENIPVLTPVNLTLTSEKEYLLVIENTVDFPVKIDYAEFGQKTYTYLIKGTPALSMDSLLLMPRSMVTWHLRTLGPGEFVWSPINSGLNIAGTPGKIDILPAKVPPRLSNLSNLPTEEALPPEKLAPEKRKRSQRK